MGELFEASESFRLRDLALPLILIRGVPDLFETLGLATDRDPGKTNAGVVGGSAAEGVLCPEEPEDSEAIDSGGRNRGDVREGETAREGGEELS